MTHKGPDGSQTRPYGSEPGRSRGLLLLLIALYFGWVAFLAALAWRDYLRP